MLTEKSKNSCLLKQFRRPRLSQQRKLLRRLRQLESRESMSQRGIMLRPSCNCSRCSNKKKQKLLLRNKKEPWKKIMKAKMLKVMLPRTNLKPCYKKVERPIRKSQPQLKQILLLTNLLKRRTKNAIQWRKRNKRQRRKLKNKKSKKIQTLKLFLKMV